MLRVSKRLESRPNSEFEIQIEVNKRHKSVVAHNNWKDPSVAVTIAKKQT